MKRENVVGRANVEDTPELEAYYRELECESLGALWNVANEIEPWYPQPKSVPTLWTWRKVEPFVRRAAELVEAEKAARRVVMLVNPGRKEWSAAAGLLYTGV
jgi:gentisate 1,2-dioxygenase